MEELQKLVDRWKQGIAAYEDFRKMCFSFNWHATGQQVMLAERQLRDCIDDAEKLLKTDTGATHGNPPLRKHHVVGRLPTK